MDTIQPPIIILVEKSYLNFESTVKDAELSLEAVDINDGLYEGYDSEGRLLNITTQGELVKITSAEEIPTHQQKLITLLKMQLTLYKCQASQEDLKTLLSTAMNYKAPYKTLGESLRDFVKNLWGKIMVK